MIECVNFKEVNSGYLVGFATLYISELGMEIPNFRLFEKDDKAWVKLPQYEYKSKEGEEKYISIGYFRKQEVFREFMFDALNAIKKYLNKDKVVKYKFNEEPSQHYEDPPLPF